MLVLDTVHGGLVLDVDGGGGVLEGEGRDVGLFQRPGMPERDEFGHEVEGAHGAGVDVFQVGRFGLVGHGVVWHLCWEQGETGSADGSDGRWGLGGGRERGTADGNDEGLGWMLKK